MRIHRLRKKIHIAVIGGNGFIGRSFIYKLFPYNNIRVFSIDKQESGYILQTKHAKCVVQQVSMDVSNQSSVTAWLSGNPVDVIVYAAGYDNPTDGFSITLSNELEALSGLYNALQGIVGMNLEAGEETPYFLYLSSAAIYGVQKKIATEETKEFPSNHAGMAKLLGEDIVKRLGNKLGLDTCILRPTEVYGKKNYKDLRVKGKWSGYISYYTDKILLASLKDQPEINIWSGEKQIDLIDIDYMADFMVRCVQERTTGIFNVGSGVKIKVIDLVNKIIDKCKLTQITINKDQSINIDNMNVDITKCAEIIPYGSYDLDKFIEANIAIRRLELAKQMAIEDIFKEPLTLDTTALRAKDAFFKRKERREVSYSKIKELAGELFNKIEYGSIQKRVKKEIESKPKLDVELSNVTKTKKSKKSLN